MHLDRKTSFTAALVTAAFGASPAYAHTFGATGAGFVDGFGHPFGGFDHLLAMVTIGLWAVQAGGRAMWAVPLTFMGMMMFGGLLGLEGVPVPGVELGIAASLMVLGSLVVFAFKPSLLLGMAIVGLFAIFHGHAHGAEMPEAASPVLYAVGFVAATGLLHGAGIAAAMLSQRYRVWAKASDWAIRSVGAAVAANGLFLIVS
jgi:urease accessory protein